MKPLTWIVGVPVAAAAVVFSVANRHRVTLDLWPFPMQVELPVYLAVLAPLLAGILLGGLAAWSAAGRTRRRARREAREIARLNREVEALKKEKADIAAKPQAAPTPELPTR